MARKAAITDGDRRKTLDEVARIGDVIDLINAQAQRHIWVRHTPRWKKWLYRLRGFEIAAIVRSPKQQEPEGQQPTGRIDAAGQVVND